MGYRWDQPAYVLSYANRRRLEIARALAARPRLLLLDEPAAGMTGTEKERLIGMIRRVREQDVTVLLVEHDMRLVMGISETVIVLNHGRVIATGPPAAIQAHPDVIRAYLGSSDAPA
jgi:branched-chain amino acid transport system ATP-binding protein